MLILAIPPSIDATATLNCAFSGSIPPQCIFISLSSVTMANEDIVVRDQPSTYKDTTTSALNFDSKTLINYIPSNIFKYFPNLLQFTAATSSVTNLVTDAFINCTSLLTILMTENNFPTIPAAFAQSCSSLRTIRMAHNNINSIDANALKGLANLDVFQVVFTNIACIPPGLFSYSPKITQIDLRNNLIVEIDPMAFINLPVVSFITFTNNSISYIPKLNFTNSGFSNSGLQVHFESNLITIVDPAFFTGFFTNRAPYWGSVGLINGVADPHGCVPGGYELVDINNWNNANNSFGTCYNNWNLAMRDTVVSCALPVSTTSAPTTTTTTTSSLALTLAPNSCGSHAICRYYLDEINRYTCVIDHVGGYATSISGIHNSPYTDANVERVFFTNSILTKVPNVLFSKFLNLNFLSISNCSLGVLNDKTFDECGNLVYLDASYNGITNVAPTALINCTKLQTLDLTGNRIGYINAKIYTYTPSLKVVKIAKIP